MGFFSSGKENAVNSTCSHCGKTILPFFTKKYFFSQERVAGYPPEKIPDTLGSVCMSCKAHLCYECRLTKQITRCGKCGSESLVTFDVKRE